MNLFEILRGFATGRILQQSIIHHIKQVASDLEEDQSQHLLQIRNHFDALHLYSCFDIEILQDERELDLTKIAFGIVAGFATWSGYSYSISSQILNGIKDASKPKLRIIVIDLDYFSVGLQKKLFEKAMHGYFECCLIVDGKIVQRHTSSTDVHSFIKVVKESR